MPVPTLVTDLSTTLASNSPAGSENVFPDLDNYLRAMSGFIASIRDNSGNGWVSPYATAFNPNYTGTLTGGTGVVNLGSGQFYKSAAGDVGIGTSSPVSYGKLAVQTDGGTGNAIAAYSPSTSNGAKLRLYDNNSNVGIDGIPVAATASTDLSFVAGGASKMRLDASGNLGLGVTPSAWASQPAIQQTGGALWGVNAANYEVLQNAFYNGTNYIYRNTNLASRYNQNAGAHSWFTAPSGTAGAAISFTQALTLHASGGMSLGNTTDPGATNLSVTGTITSGKGANVASTSTVTLGAGNFFDITGTTTISAITIKPAGTVVYLKFDSTINLQTGTIGNSGAMRLAGAGTLVATQYDVLTLISDGTNWWQTAFSAN